ncbi:MAG: hypothetical protein ACYC8T_06055 [Myxococcaceae bacterium]
MKNVIVAAVFVVSSLAFAAPPAAAPAAAPVAKAAPVVAAPAAVAAADCDMHKGEAGMMKEMMGAKVKMSMVKLDHGTTGIITADAKNSAVVEKLMTNMEAGMKGAMEGKAKLCGECEGMVAAMKAGKVMGGIGRNGNVWTNTMLSSDPEIVKQMHAQVDAKMPAAPAKKK